MSFLREIFNLLRDTIAEEKVMAKESRDNHVGPPMWLFGLISLALVVGLGIAAKAMFPQ